MSRRGKYPGDNRFKDFIVKFLFSLGVFVVCHIPIGLIVIFKYLLSPEGFWQKIATCGVGTIIFGGAQLILWVVLVIILFLLWVE